MVDLVAVVSYPNQTGGVILWANPEENWMSAGGRAREMYPVGTPFYINDEKLKLGNFGYGKVYVPKRVMAKYGHLRKDGRYAFLLHPRKMLVDGEEVLGGKVINFPGVEKLLETPQNRDILTVCDCEEAEIDAETAWWSHKDWYRNPGIWFDKNNNFDDDETPVKTEEKTLKPLAGPRITVTVVVSRKNGVGYVNPFLKGKGDYEGEPHYIGSERLITGKNNKVTIPRRIMSVGYVRKDGRFALALTQGWTTYHGERISVSHAYVKGLEQYLETAENGEVIVDPYNRED